MHFFNNKITLAYRTLAESSARSWLPSHQLRAQNGAQEAGGANGQADTPLASAEGCQGRSTVSLPPPMSSTHQNTGLGVKFTLVQNQF